MFLPTGSPTARAAAGWEDAKHAHVVAQATADVDGGAVVELESVPAGERWLVDRLVVSTSSGGAGARFLLYVDTLEARGLVDGTNAGGFDVNDCDSPIRLEAGARLIGEWTGALPGDVCTLRVQYVAQTQGGDEDGF